MSNPLPIPAPIELIILSIWTSRKEGERTRVREVYGMCKGKSFLSNKANLYFWIQVSHNMIITPASTLYVSHSLRELKKHGGAEGGMICVSRKLKDSAEERWRRRETGLERATAASLVSGCWLSQPVIPDPEPAANHWSVRPAHPSTCQDSWLTAGHRNLALLQLVQDQCFQGQVWQMQTVFTSWQTTKQASSLEQGKQKALVHMILVYAT